MTELDDLTPIRARVWEVCARTGVADEQLAEVIGADPGRIAASFACERRFSTYELAAIAEHGRTTVEWLCGDSDEYDPNAYLAALAARYQLVLDALPKQETTPGAAEWLVAEMNDWAPLRAEANRALLGDEDWDDEPSARWFWWHADQLTHRWRPLYWGSDEHCNRTIGVRLPGGVLFLCLTVPLRQEECGECRTLA